MSLSVNSCKALWLQHTCSPSPAQSCWADDGADQHLPGLRAATPVADVYPRVTGRASVKPAVKTLPVVG